MNDYKSKIGLCLNPEGYSTFFNIIEDTPEELEIRKILDLAEYHCFKNNKFWYWNNIKWSGKIFNLINYLLLNYLHDKQYLFIRIGENQYDIEQYGEYFNNPFKLKLTFTFYPDNDA